MVAKRTRLFLSSIIAVLLLSLSFNLVAPYTSYADYAPGADGKCEDGKIPEGAEKDGEKQCSETQRASTAEEDNPAAVDDNATECAIAKMGWILCPVIETAAKAADNIHGLLSRLFLNIEPELLSSNTDRGTYVAWSYARNIANIMFIIVFMVIIYSQVTGAGISNYGIKKMLPRLIIAVFAVNLSYYISQFMVDISNILGHEIYNMLREISLRISEQAPFPSYTSKSGVMNVSSTDGFLGKVALFVVGAAAFVWFLFPLLFGGIGVVLAATLMIVVILLMRKAFIILLVVLSPIAFVAYLLPNTESLYKKWLGMFWKLLMVFPVVSLLMGSGVLASAIILQAGSVEPKNYMVGNPSDTKQCLNLPDFDQSGQNANTETEIVDCPGGNARAVPMSLGIVAAVISIVPLFAVWAVLKGALAAAGAIGGKVSGIAENLSGKAGNLGGKADSRLRGLAKDNAKAAFQDRLAKGYQPGATGVNRMMAKLDQRANKGKNRRGTAEGELNRARTSYLADNIAEDDNAGLGKNASQAAISRAKAQAISTREKMDMEDAAAAHSYIDNKDKGELASIIDDANRSMGERIAAFEKYAELADVDEVNRMVDKHTKGGRTSLSVGISNKMAKDGPKFFSAGDIGQMASGQFSGGSTNAMISRLNEGAWNPGTLINASGNDIVGAHRSLQNIINDDSASDELRQEAQKALSKVQESALQVMTDPSGRLQAGLGRNEGAIKNLAEGREAGYIEE